MFFSKEKIIKLRECNNKIFSPELIQKFNNIIFIYTPPKVGSTTLVSSLRMSISNTYLITHIHDENMLNVLTNYDHTNTITITEIIEYNSYIGKKVFVIDVYRNPIERKISEYFEILANFHFNNTENNMSKYKLDLIIKRFNKIFPYIGDGDYYYDKYPITIPESFDFEKKYLNISNNNVQYIKLRLSDANIWGIILSKIFNREIIIIKDYETENKVIGELYKKFKNTYKIPSNFFENIKNCLYFNYYNSETEKLEYLNYWNNKQTDNFIPYNIDEYVLYKDISRENQFYNIIQRNHYTDFGCICKSCFIKRKQIINRLKRGEKNVNLKVMHEEVVEEKKIKKIKVISKICNSIKNKHESISNNTGPSTIFNGVIASSTPGIHSLRR